MFSCHTVNLLTNGILLTFLSSQSKNEKAIDNVRIVLNKINLALFTASLWRVFPSLKNKLTSGFYASILLLKINVVITLSKFNVEPL